MKRNKTTRVKKQPSTKPEHERGDNESNKCHVCVEPGLQIDFVKNFRDEYAAGQKQNTTDNNKQLFWTKISAFLLLLYVGLTLLIYRANEKSAETAVKAFTEARKSSESETRAMVKLHRNGQLQVIKDRRIELPVRVDNIGKTPARDVVTYTYVQVVPKNESLI